jgi:hypothetical protein
MVNGRLQRALAARMRGCASSIQRAKSGDSTVNEFLSKRLEFF